MILLAGRLSRVLRTLEEAKEICHRVKRMCNVLQSNTSGDKHPHCGVLDVLHAITHAGQSSEHQPAIRSMALMTSWHCAYAACLLILVSRVLARNLLVQPAAT